MNKLIGAIGLLMIVPAVAMELVISEKENSAFVQHLSRAVGFSKKVVEENKIPAENPIHLSLIKLSNDISTHDNNLMTMIKSDTIVENELKNYMIKIDSSNELIKFGLDQIYKKAGDIEEARKYVIRTRQLSAGLDLQKREPNYINQWIGEVQNGDRINFMLRNTALCSIKNYIALLIYQMVFAYQIDEKVSV